MLHHVSVGVRDVERATQFYDAILAVLGYKRVMEFLPYAVAYGEKHPSFWVQLPHNQQIATAGNGVHISFIGRTKEAIDRFHRTAMELGAADAGPSGPRPEYGPDYYGAFVIDLDGNKLEATLMPEPVVKAKPAKAKKAKAKAARKPAKKAAKKTAKKAAKKPVKKTSKKTKKKTKRR